MLATPRLNSTLGDSEPHARRNVLTGSSPLSFVGLNSFFIPRGWNIDMSLIYQAPAFGGGGPRSGIYLGGKADAKDKDKLMNQWNVTHILNVTPPKQAGIQVNILARCTVITD
jgi:hypothetical protein